MEIDDNNKEEIERIIIDPISLAVIEDALVTPCGHSFSEQTIKDWLERSKTCPLCHSELKVEDLTPNYSLREIIDHISQQQQQSSIDQQKQQQLTNQKNQELSSQISLLASQLAQLSSKINNDNSSNNNSVIINQQQQENIILNQPQECYGLKPLVPEESLFDREYCIREIWANEATEGSKLMERSTRDDPFMNWFFQKEYWKQSGSEWYLEKMIMYAVKRARVWGMFKKQGDKKMVGIMICQQPFEIGISLPSMMKVGMLGAPFKMGMGPLSRVLSLFDVTEKLHQQLTESIPHWYINALTMDPIVQHKGLGRILLQTVLNLADAQKVSVYIDTAHPLSLKFLDSFDFKVKYHSSNSSPPFWALMRDPQPVKIIL